MISILKNVRARLTFWYLLVLAFVLILFAGISIMLVFLNLRNNLDRQLEKDYEIIEDYIRVAPNGKVTVDDDDDEPYSYERWFDIWSPQGKLLYSSRPFTGQSLTPLSSKNELKQGFIFASLNLPNQVRVRIMRGMINIDGHWLYIRLIHNEERLWRELQTFFWLMMIALPLAILLAGIGGFVLAKKFLAPIDQMAKKARKIGEENLQERLPVLNADDELGNLTIAFNELLERLQKSFVRLKQFTSDAAHELRTPLTAIRSIGEVGLQNRKDSEQYREIIGSILEENHRLTHLVDNLLFLSRVDSRSLNLNLETIELESLVRQVIELIKPLAEEKNQQLLVRGKSGKAVADAALLKQALLNLLDNAIKYAPENTSVVVYLQTDDVGEAIIQVVDEGAGIPMKEREKIFERFYRVDKGRSREMGGNGLGLAIARWAIQIQGGSITVDTHEGKGSVFKMVLKKNV